MFEVFHVLGNGRRERLVKTYEVVRKGMIINRVE